MKVARRQGQLEVIAVEKTLEGIVTGRCSHTEAIPSSQRL